uniref:Uncharacterized protein n=1 Tax=Ixodes ricinus TaxID=34613 RepID=A0A147BE95_IXORI
MPTMCSLRSLLVSGRSGLTASSAADCLGWAASSSSPSPPRSLPKTWEVSRRKTRRVSASQLRCWMRRDRQSPRGSGSGPPPAPWPSTFTWRSRSVLSGPRSSRRQTQPAAPTPAGSRPFSGRMQLSQPAKRLSTSSCFSFCISSWLEPNLKVMLFTLLARSLQLSTWTQTMVGRAWGGQLSVSSLVLLRSSSPDSQKVSVELSLRLLAMACRLEAFTSVMGVRSRSTSIVVVKA